MRTVLGDLVEALLGHRETVIRLTKAESLQGFDADLVRMTAAISLVLIDHRLGSFVGTKLIPPERSEALRQSAECIRRLSRHLETLKSIAAGTEQIAPDNSAIVADAVLFSHRFVGLIATCANEDGFINSLVCLLSEREGGAK